MTNVRGNSGDASVVWIVSEPFDGGGSTAMYIRGIVRAAATVRRVGVITVQGEGEAIDSEPTPELGPVVRIKTISSRHHSVLMRFSRALYLSARFFLVLLRKCKRGDTMFVVTNPPTLPWVVLAVAKLTRARSILLVYDVYPDVLRASGHLSSRSSFYKILDSMSAWLTAKFDTTIAIGQDMMQLLIAKNSAASKNITLIPNWADVPAAPWSDPRASSFLKRLGISEKFVVQYAGTMGHTHDIELIAAAAHELAPANRVQFLFIGDGAKKLWLEEFVHENKLDNITILPYSPSESKLDALRACHVSIFSFVAGMKGVSVPSRMYNVFAAGRPIIGVAEGDSELGLVIENHRVGWIVAPGDRSGLVRAIEEARADTEQLKEMGGRGRALVQQQYSYEVVSKMYADLFREG